MSIDTIGNFLTIIRNGLMVNKRVVAVQHSKEKEAVATVLKNEGYIRNFKASQEAEKPVLTVTLKYVSGEPVIHGILRISTPGRRQYEKRNNLTSVMGGLGVSIVTTNKGIMSDKQAKKLGVGGEVICHVW